MVVSGVYDSIRKPRDAWIKIVSVGDRWLLVADFLAGVAARVVQVIGAELSFALGDAVRDTSALPILCIILSKTGWTMDYCNTVSLTPSYLHDGELN